MEQKGIFKDSQGILQLLWERDIDDIQAIAKTVELTTVLGIEKEQWDPGGHYCLLPVSRLTFPDRRTLVGFCFRYLKLGQGQCLREEY